MGYIDHTLPGFQLVERLFNSLVFEVILRDIYRRSQEHTRKNAAAVKNKGE